MDETKSENGAATEQIPSNVAVKKDSTNVEVREVEHKAINAFNNVNFFNDEELAKVKVFLGEYIKSSKNGSSIYSPPYPQASQEISLRLIFRPRPTIHTPTEMMQIASTINKILLLLNGLSKPM